MARDFIQIDEFRKRARAGEFVSGKDAGVAVQISAIGSAAIDVEKREATFAITDATVDRSNDVLNPDGGDWTAYQKNPVFLWAHDYSLLPIGRCVKGPYVEGGQVKATFRYHDASKSPLAEMVWQQVLDGTLRAVSIGFVPKKWSVPDSEEQDARGYGINFDEYEGIEVSQVPVPCNPNALLDDGKGIAALEAFTKSLRAARAAKEQPVATSKLMLHVEIPEGKDAKSIEAELVKKAKNLGAEAKSADDAADAGTDDKLHAQMADHVKAMGEHCGAMADHTKAFGALHKDYTAAVGEAQAHAKAMDLLVGTLGEALESGAGDAKGFSARLAKIVADYKLKAGSDALSKSQMSHVKSIAKHANAAISAHHDAQGAVDGEPDADGDDDGDKPDPKADDKGASPLHVAAEAEAKRLNIPVADVIAAWTKRALAVSAGALD